MHAHSDKSKHMKSKPPTPKAFFCYELIPQPPRNVLSVHTQSLWASWGRCLQHM